VSSRLPHLALVVSLAVHAAVSAAVLAWGHDRRATAKASETDPPPSLAGETFDVPDLDREPVEQPSGAPPSVSPATAAHAHAAHAAPAFAKDAPASNADIATAGGEAKSPPLFGAVGERGVVDLATTFTRAFPQVASADANWTHVAYGTAGSADVILEIDDTGHLIDARIAGAPSASLREGIERTFALLRTRVFIANAAITRLHIVSIVSPDAVHDGLHGDVFAIGGSFSGHEGSAFFALSVGRRIDVTITRR